MNVCRQLKFNIKLSHTVYNTLLSRRFSVAVRPILSIQVHMLLRSPPILSLYLCKAWIDKELMIYAWNFNSILLIIYHYITMKTLFEDYAIEPPR